MLEVMSLSKMTKTQMRNSLKAIDAKARKLFVQVSHPNVMSSADLTAIQKIIAKGLRNLK
tara:strand:- start:1327 stop:1506 length:180 start_codon:yes stop_codon:yes gene_type:complete